MLTGYLSSLSCFPGESVDVMVSSTDSEVTIDLVRLLRGDTNSLGPGFVYEEVDAVVPVTVIAKEARTSIGSSGYRESTVAINRPFLISLFAWPTLLISGRAQTLFALPDLGLALQIDAAGHFALSLNGRPACRLVKPLSERVWYKFSVAVNSAVSSVTVEGVEERTGRLVLVKRVDGSGLEMDGVSTVVLAASSFDRVEKQLFSRDLFNSKIARPQIEVRDAILSRWAFEKEMSGQIRIDAVGDCHLEHRTFNWTHILRLSGSSSIRLG